MHATNNMTLSGPTSWKIDRMTEWGPEADPSIDRHNMMLRIAAPSGSEVLTRCKPCRMMRLQLMQWSTRTWLAQWWALRASNFAKHVSDKV